jgi:hypothetical protein
LTLLALVALGVFFCLKVKVVRMGTLQGELKYDLSAV